MDIIQTLINYEEQGYLAKRTIHEEFMLAAKKYPNKTALVDQEGSLTYEELNAYSNELACYFLHQGLEQGDNVLLQIPNCNLYGVVLLALLKAGIIPALLLPTHREKEIVSVANAIKAKAYIGITEFLGVEYVKMVASMDTKDLPIQMIFTEQELEGDSNYPCKIISKFDRKWLDVSFEEYQRDYRSTALYLLSGGTTNLPKVIPRIHEAYAYNSKAAAKYANISEKTVYMAVLSTSHDFALASPGLLGTLYHGGTVVFCQTAGFDEAFRNIEEHHVTFTCIVPAIAQVWIEILEWYEGDFSSLENMVIGAAKLERSTALALIEKLDIRLQQAYGLGEGITCYTSLNDSLDTILETQGKPVSKGDAVRIVDEKGNSLPPYEKGELFEKGPYTFFGYYGNEQLNESLFTEEGYLRTGDKAYLDDAGNIVICGRVKEQINRAGENVLPVEVETILRKHPDIKDAAVFGREDVNLGERTAAVIITENEQLTLFEISKFFIQLGVAQYKIPDELHIWKELKYTNVGKVDKKRMKTMLEESEKE